MKTTTTALFALLFVVGCASEPEAACAELCDAAPSLGAECESECVAFSDEHPEANRCESDAAWAWAAAEYALASIRECPVPLDAATCPVYAESLDVEARFACQ